MVPGLIRVGLNLILCFLTLNPGIIPGSHKLLSFWPAQIPQNLGFSDFMGSWAWLTIARAAASWRLRTNSIGFQSSFFCGLCAGCDRVADTAFAPYDPLLSGLEGLCSRV